MGRAAMRAAWMCLCGANSSARTHPTVKPAPFWTSRIQSRNATSSLCAVLGVGEVRCAIARMGKRLSRNRANLTECFAFTPRGSSIVRRTFVIGIVRTRIFSANSLQTTGRTVLSRVGWFQPMTGRFGDYPNERLLKRWCHVQRTQRSRFDRRASADKFGPAANALLRPSSLPCASTLAANLRPR